MLRDYQKKLYKILKLLKKKMYALQWLRVQAKHIRFAKLRKGFI